jgi:hypothetical protein
VPIFTSDNFWRYGRATLRILILTNPLFWLYQIPPVGRAVRWMLRPFRRKRGEQEGQRTFRVRR